MSRHPTPQATRSKPSPRFALRPTAVAVHLLLAGMAIGGWVGAAQAQTATAASTRSYNIPAGPLNAVLTRFLGESGVLLSGSTELAQGKQSPGVQGNLTPDAALAALLAGTGLQAVADAQGRYVLRVAPVVTRSGEAQLAPVTVTADRTEVGGYVGKRVTTATKTDTSVIETPQSISVVTREEMDARGARDVGEAASYTAGVFTGGTGETARFFGGNGVQVRGYGGNGTAGNSFNEYLDGLRFRGTLFAGANLDSYLFERVEILKGPASVLFGQTQPGGIVNLVSKLPGQDTGNEIVLGTGNHDRATGAFDFGGALGENVHYRIVGLALEGETQQDPSERSRRLLAPSLRWADDTTSLTLLAHYQRDDVDATVQNSIPAAGVFSNPNGKISRNFRVGDPNFELWDREIWSLGYLFSHRINNDLTVRQNLRYTRNELDSRWLFRSGLNPDLRTLRRNAFTAVEHSDNVALDNQLEWKFTTGSVRHTLLAGVDYQRLSHDTRRAFGAVTPIDLFAPTYGQNIPAPTNVIQHEKTVERQLGVYLQNHIQIGALSLLVGGRHDDAQSHTVDRLGDPESRTRANAFTGRIGAIYNFANGFSPYVSYSESFEPVSGASFDGTRFQPTEGQQFELGLKYLSADGRQLFTASVFDLTQQNVLTSDPNNPGFSVQTGEVRTKGLELEGKMEYDNGVALTASYAYLDDKVTRSNDVNLGKRRVQIPEHNASLWGSYAFRGEVLNGLSVGLGARYVGKTQADNVNSRSVPSYTLIDAALSYDLHNALPAARGWSLNLTGRNLGGKQYVASCLNANICYLGLERSYQLTAKYRW